MILDREVFVHPAGDEAVSAYRDRGVLANANGGQGAEDRRRVIVDGAARKDVDRPALDQQPPVGEVAHVGMEEPVRHLAGLDIARPIRDEERIPVEYRQFFCHRPRLRHDSIAKGQRSRAAGSHPGAIQTEPADGKDPTERAQWAKRSERPAALRRGSRLGA